MTPDHYHRILMALDVVLDSFEEPSVVLSADEAKIQHELRVIRSKILKAESGHPFPFSSQTTSASPTGPTPQAEITAPPFSLAPAAERRIRILVVDDQESVRTVVRLLIEVESDMQVVGQAVNGQQGLEMAVELRPDIILLDVNMPVMDGFVAAKHILAALRTTKVIMFSANRSDEYLEKARQLGITTYLTKPASRTQLISAIRSNYAESLLLRRADVMVQQRSDAT